jgi:hypothetical protein
MTDLTAWPELPYAQWAPTKKTLQMVAQMLGKLRLSLSPALPEWLHASLQLDPRGFSTGSMPTGTRTVSALIDVFDSAIVLRVSDGGERRVAIGPARCVADIWADFSAALDELGVAVDVWQKPQELADTTPFSENRHDCTFVAADAQRHHRLLTTIDGIFEDFRSPFFGRSGIQFWWGAFDYAVLLFNGEHAPAPDDKGYIMRYDLDAVHLNAGFWVGDDTAPAPGFYAYLSPQPDGCATAPVGPNGAGWVESMGEWMLSYDAVLACPDPASAVREFLDSVYSIATSLGGWDAEKLSYKLPAPSARR